MKRKTPSQPQSRLPQGRIQPFVWALGVLYFSLSCYYKYFPLSHEIAFIMDDGLDDLFGDGAPLQLPEPLPKGLLQRIDELYLSGCSQYVRSPPFDGNV